MMLGGGFRDIGKRDERGSDVEAKGFGLRE